MTYVRVMSAFSEIIPQSTSIEIWTLENGQPGQFAAGTYLTEGEATSICDALSARAVAEGSTKLYGVVVNTTTRVLVFDPTPPSDDPVEPEPGPEPEPQAQFRTVWRDAGTGEYVTEEYAIEHPDTTVSEQELITD